MAYEFENLKTNEGIRYTRYIMSWLKETLPYDPFPDSDFEEWLEQRGLTKDEIIDIRMIGTTGKFELEQDIKRFIKDNEIKLYNG